MKNEKRIKMNLNKKRKEDFCMKRKVLSLLILTVTMLCGCGSTVVSEVNTSNDMITSEAAPIDEKVQPITDEITEVESAQVAQASGIPFSEVPAYSGQAYAVIDQNIPEFSEDEKTTVTFETYSELDTLGRCGVAYANICPDIMPTEERGEIGMIKPSGWHTIKYDCVDGKYLYNRCHLIAYMLAGENANEKNLITGTRYLNINGMLPFETQVNDYVKSTNHHVLYRVTPVYDGTDLVASGVQMEAYSVEDQGSGICFNVYVYNIQPGVTIDYATGDSALSGEAVIPSTDAGTKAIGTEQKVTNDTTIATTQGITDSSVTASSDGTYILNTNTKKFHYPSCSSVDAMKESNKQSYTGSRDDLISQGYSPCKRCNP